MAQIELPKKEIVELYNRGFMVSVIAKHYYVAPSTIRNRLLKWGISPESSDIRQEKILRTGGTR